MCRAPKSLYMVEAVRKMKKFLSFVLFLNLLMPVKNVCAETTKAGVADNKKATLVKEKKEKPEETSNICKGKLIDMISAVITASGTIIGFYILGQYISTLNLKQNIDVKVPNPNINVKLDPMKVKIEQINNAENKGNDSPGWFYKTVSTIGCFVSGNLSFLFSFFRGDCAPPPAG